MLEVKRLRLAREWNQTELAYHAGLAPSVISEIENGKRDPSARTLRKLAEALNVDVADLFPKAQAPLPEFEEARRVPLFIGAVFVTAQAWRQSIADIDIHKVPGIIEAALDLAEQISPGLGPQSLRVSPDAYLPALDALSLLRQSAQQGIHRLGWEEASGQVEGGLIEEYHRRLDAIWDAERENLEAGVRAKYTADLPTGLDASSITEENLLKVREEIEEQKRRLRSQVPSTEAATND